MVFPYWFRSLDHIYDLSHTFIPLENRFLFLYLFFRSFTWLFNRSTIISIFQIKFGIQKLQIQMHQLDSSMFNMSNSFLFQSTARQFYWIFTIASDNSNGLWTMDKECRFWFRFLILISNFNPTSMASNFFFNFFTKILNYIYSISTFS